MNPCSILVIDDQPESLDLFRLLLRTYLPEAEIRLAQDGEEGLRLVAERAPDLVLADVKMPDVDGFEVCRRIKENPATRDVPVLLVSGVMVGLKHRVHGMELGAEGYICKPFEALEFVAQIKSLVRLKHSRDELRRSRDQIEKALEQRTTDLRRSEEKFRTIFDGSPDAIFIEGEDGIVLDANPAACRLHRLPRDQVVGRHFLDLIPEAQRPLAQTLFPKWFTGELTSCESLSATATGEAVPVQIHGGAIQLPGGRAVLLQVRDMTSHHEMENQLRQSQKMEAIGRLAGGVAHDFNNLLTSILGFSWLVLNRLGQDHPLAQYVQETINAGERASELTRRLLSFSRKQAVAKTPVNLNSAVQELRNILVRTLGEDIELRLDTHPQTGTIEADVSQIDQIVMNLAINARDAMPRGGRLTISTEPAEVDDAFCLRHMEARPGRYAVLAVDDTGVGMSAEVRAHLFEPFFTTKDKGQGTGLGLSTVYGIVRQHGGFILLDTAEGAGCRFRIYLPLMNESTAEEEAEAAPEKIRAPRRSDETVLVAEDEAAVRRLMAGIVRLQGYATLEAEDGEAALAAAEKLGRPLDLLIADVVMPKLGGVELAQRLRQKFPALRVLYVTGFTDRQNVAQMAQQQGDHYLEKPFARGRLLDAVEAALAAPPRRS